MAWNTQEIEACLKACLEKKYRLALNDAEKYYDYYIDAREFLLSEKVYQGIQSQQKDLSDHGENHIMEVLANAYKLLGLKDDPDKIDAIQLYFICMLILFHDVGNLIAGRATHNEEGVIRQIYDKVREGKTGFNQERLQVPSVASKHSGIARDGSFDTIKDLDPLPIYLFDTAIEARNCAGLLRFADELAEGPQRTSVFMNKYFNYPYQENSVIYHKYAEITTINIDRKTNRICVTYMFTIKAENGVIPKKEKDDFIGLFCFTLQRMLKLEAERKYCKYYCTWLEPFKMTQVTFNFWVENHSSSDGQKKAHRVDTELQSIELNDLHLPSKEQYDDFMKKRTDLEPDKIFADIEKSIA